MSVLIFPEGTPIRHPYRRVSDDELRGRSMCDIQDPDAYMPTHCSKCRREATADNPLTLKPVNRDPRALVKSYLYAAWCAECCSGWRR